MRNFSAFHAFSTQKAILPINAHALDPLRAACRPSPIGWCLCPRTTRISGAVPGRSVFTFR